MSGLINPQEVKQEAMPLITLSDDRRGFLGWAIKAHSHGQYNHIMELYKPAIFASQDPQGFRDIPVGKYMKSYIMLKFWSCVATRDQQIAWQKLIQKDINGPNTAYDFLGIIGQALGLRWLQNPHLKYCSERVAGHLRTIFNMDIPKQPTPSELNELFKKTPGFTCVGYHFND